MSIITSNLSKVLTLLVFSIILQNLGFAQDDRLDEIPFEEEEIVDNRSKPYGAVAGGFIYNFLFMNFDDLNAKMSEIGLSELSGPLQVYGGQGFTVLPWIPNVRFGVMGAGGSTLTDKTIDVNTGITSQAEYSVTYTGLAIDYGWVVTDGLAVLGGATFGFGSQELAIYNGTDITWGQIIEPQPLINQGIQKLEQGLILIQPQLSIEWAFTDLFMLRANASYNLNLSTDDNWEYNNVSTITDMPEINPNGFNVQLGLFVGLFNY